MSTKQVPLSRKKACKACAQMKRRCDMFHPSCSRCSKKGIQCVYNANTSNPLALFMVGITKELDIAEKNKRRTSAISSHSVSQLAKTTSASLPLSTSPSTFGTFSNYNTVDNDSNLINLIRETGQDSTESLISEILGDNSLMTPNPDISPSSDESVSSLTNSDSSFSYYNNGSNNDNCQRDIQQDVESSKSSNKRSFSTMDIYSSDSSQVSTPASIMNISSMSHGHRHITSAPLVRLGHFNQSCDFGGKLGSPTETSFVIERCKHYPSLFVRYINTPFIHSSLYEDQLPHSLELALSICALNEKLSDKNTHAMLMSINNLSESLVSQAIPSDIRDLLALAQALCLTQCIRLFNGDIRTSSLGERAVPKVITLLDHLVEYFINNFTPNPGWGQWVLMESISRTIFIGYLCHFTYCSLRGDYFYDLTAGISVTLSKRLWQAQTVSAWQKGKEIDPPYLCQPISPKKIPIENTDWVIQKFDFDFIDYEYFLCVVMCSSLRNLENLLGRSLREFPEFLDGAGLLPKSQDLIVQ